MMRMRNLAAVRRHVLLLSSATGLCAGLAAVPALAQTNDAPASQTAVADPNDIVVTAQKRSQSINKTSVAVTALNQDQLRTAGIITVRDLTSTIPDVQVHTVGPVGYSGVSIRGITNQDFSQLGSPAVATYVDGVYVAVSSALSGGLYDIERMEILRGPQGTTYGQNSTGGNVNIVTADPKHVFGASADISYGNYNDVQAHAMVNLPITDDLAVRGAIMVHRSDGYLDTQGTTARNYAAADQFGGRVSALWTPGTDFRWKLTLERLIDNGTPSNMLLGEDSTGHPLDGGSPYSQPFTGPHAEPDINLRGFSVRSRMDLKLGDNMSLAYVAGYQHQYSSYVFGILASNGQESYDGDWIDRVRAYSNELDLNMKFGRLENIVGVSQFAKSNPFEKAFHFYAFGVNIDVPGGANQSSAGIFDQATYSILDTVRLIGGVRWSRESQNTNATYSTVSCPIAAGLPVSFAAIFTQGGAGCTTTTTPYAKGSWSNISWKGGAEWDVNTRTLAYFTVTNGFKSGEVQPGLPSQFSASVAPEQVINYELGVKTRLLDGALNLRAAAFNDDYKNIQVTQVTTANNLPYVFTQNAASAHIYGVELEFNYAITPRDHFNGFANYLHATYSHYLNGVDGQTGDIVPDLDGKYLPDAPKFSFRASYGHDFALPGGGTLTPEAAVYYQAKSFLREFNFPVDLVPAYTRTDVNLTYKDPSERWTVAGYATNLENKAVREEGNTAALSYFSDYLPPRQFGVRLAFTY